MKNRSKKHYDLWDFHADDNCSMIDWKRKLICGIYGYGLHNESEVIDMKSIKQCIFNGNLLMDILEL